MEVRRNTAESLSALVGVMPDKAIELYKKGLSDDDVWVRIGTANSLNALASTKPDKFIKSYEKGLKNVDVLIRITAPNLEILFKEMAEELGIPLEDDSDSEEYSVWGHKDENIIISYSKSKDPEEHDFELASFLKEGISDIAIAGKYYKKSKVINYIIQFKVAVKHYEKELNKIQYDEALRNPDLHLSGLLRGRLIDRGPPTEEDIKLPGTRYFVVRTDLCELKGVKTFVCNQFKMDLNNP